MDGGVLKLLGGYSKLENIGLEDVLLDFTGGLIEYIDFTSINTEMARVEMFEKIKKILDDGVIIVLVTKHDIPARPTLQQDESQVSLDDNSTQSDNTSYSGLLPGHPYLVTRLIVVPENTSMLGAILDAFRPAASCRPKAHLARLQCPLITETGGVGIGEWKGAWSEGSKVTFSLTWLIDIMLFC
ncbi:unnamed protein product [Protopolystoma xenopodis]|uniref:Calpain catalytic domain-containing protein n=1 Tax=Protopolystoma xenopodis TaxID=117903 RepID=A0A3S5CIV4_9PLAT|nr:unnamed protein product [Protopolystoma xenopodis]